MSIEHHVTRIPALKHRDHWDVLYQNKVIVTNAYAPFGAAARALQAMGHTGKLIMFDQRGMACLIGSIEAASKQTIRENEKIGPVFVKHRPFNKKDQIT